MEVVFYVLVSIISGVLGGMGMGGGTLLIPLLTILFSMVQQTAQGLNLISFIPMAIVVLIVHIKNKLVNFKGILYVIIPAILFAVLGSILSTNIDTNVLKKCFGGFLILLSFLQFFQDKIQKNTCDKQQKKIDKIAENKKK